MSGAARQRARMRDGYPTRGESSAQLAPQKKSSASTQALNYDPPSRAEATKNWQQYAANPSQGPAAFSLRNQAKNTNRHGDWFNTRLRDNKIAFVSAGNLVREEESKVESEEFTVSSIQQDLQPEKTGNEIVNAERVRREELRVDNTIDEQVKNLEISGESEESDRSSTQQRKTSMSSVDEVIVFAGRKGLNSTMKSFFSDPRATESSVPAAVVVSEAPQSAPSPPDKTFGNPSTLNAGVADLGPGASGSTRKPLPPTSSKAKASSYRERVAQEEIDEADAIMQDYIDNMANDDEDESDDNDAVEASQARTSKPPRKNETFRYYDGTGAENEKIQTTASKGKMKSKSSADILDNLIWSSDDLEDFDGMSTTDEEVDEISQILRKRRRPTGLQYLVTAVGTAIEDAKWVPAEKMTSGTAREEIRIWQEIRNIEWRESDNLDESEESNDSDEKEALDDLVDQINSDDDENARILDRTNKMTDSQLARALQKQEDLGLGGDELNLFDGQEPDAELDEVQRGDDFVPFSTQTHTSNRSRTKRNRRAKDNFPSATAFADALNEDPYGGFDVMDFDRPSLKPKKKGRKGELPIELQEDNEWEAQLEKQWQTDRQKKKTRKQQRDEARMAGLLCAAARDGRADLHVKYANSGMNSSQIKDEIRTFLTQDFESLSLASMDAPMRASVHRLAKALDLKSHSSGSGDNRHPILTKTSWTSHYTESNIREIDALMELRKFFPKPGGWGSSKATAKSVKIRRGGGGALAGASYMDGDVVGASAPELGAENKGFALLQKMGWASGQAIGALGNKGSIDVIKHVVKNSKAGLG